MPWYAHAWSLIALAVGVVFVVVLAMTLGWWPLVFAVAIGLPVFLGSRRWARRRLG